MDLGEIEARLEHVEGELRSIEEAAAEYDDDFIETVSGHSNDMRKSTEKSRIYARDALDAVSRLTE